MRIDVNGRHAVIIKEDALIENANAVFHLECVFDDMWEGLIKTAVFRAGSVKTYATLKDDKCDIPAQCLNQGGVTLRINIIGENKDNYIQTNLCQTSPILYNIVSYSSNKRKLYYEFMSAISEIPESDLNYKTLSEILSDIEENVGITATDEEVEYIIDNAFNKKIQQYEDADTASNEEVDNILNDVFGS